MALAACGPRSQFKLQKRIYVMTYSVCGENTLCLPPGGANPWPSTIGMDILLVDKTVVHQYYMWTSSLSYWQKVVALACAPPRCTNFINTFKLQNIYIYIYIYIIQYGIIQYGISKFDKNATLNNPILYHS